MPTSLTNNGQYLRHYITTSIFFLLQKFQVSSVFHGYPLRFWKTYQNSVTATFPSLARRMSKQIMDSSLPQYSNHFI